MPKISVIVPVYNVEKFLPRCVESILMQTLDDLEIICIDDGSMDESGRILDGYAVQDERLRVVHQENRGYGAAMNTGLAMAANTSVSWRATTVYCQRCTRHCIRRLLKTIWNW